MSDNSSSDNGLEDLMPTTSVNPDGALQLFDEGITAAAAILTRISNDDSTEINSSEDGAAAANSLDSPRISFTESYSNEERAATSSLGDLRSPSLTTNDFTEETQAASTLLNLHSDSPNLCERCGIDDEDKFVRIYIGREREEFDAPKGLLCNNSKFFNDLFHPPSCAGYYNIPEFDADNFERIISWLEGRDLSLQTDPAPEDFDVLSLFIDLYAFSLKLEMPKLSEFIMTRVGSLSYSALRRSPVSGFTLQP